MAQKIRVGGVIQNDYLASISVLAVRDQPGAAATVLEALGERSLNVQFVVQTMDQQDQDQMVLCVDRDDLAASLAALEAVRLDLGTATVLANSHVASVAVFGPDFRERPGIAAQMFRSLARHGVNILAISTSISTVNCIVESARLQEAIAAIQESFELP